MFSVCRSVVLKPGIDDNSNKHLLIKDGSSSLVVKGGDSNQEVASTNHCTGYLMDYFHITSISS